MRVENISHRTGDQLPLLLDSDGLPIVMPNEFIMARRALSPNTLVRNLRELSVLYRWLQRENIDLLARIKSDRNFTEAEIIGSMVEALRREQGKMQKVKQMAVSSHTFNQRLTTLRQFLDWCFDVELGSMPRADDQYDRVRNHKKMVNDWLGSAFISAPPSNKGIRKGLNNQEINFLIECLDPANPEAVGRNSAVRFRNYISTMIMLYYGLRPGELLSLRIEDVEIGAISGLRVERRPPDPSDVRKPRPQIKRNGRILPIDNPVFAQRIDEYIMTWRDELERKNVLECDYLVLSDEGEPLSQSTLTQLYQHLRRKFPEQLPSHLTAKALRHSFSSRMEREMRESGMDEDRRRQALAYLRGDSSLESQSQYIAQEIEEQSNRALKKYQKNLICEDIPW